jgi:hypothetical protein
MMAHAEKPDFVFRRNGRVHLNWRERQYSRLLAAEVCASAVVMLDTPCSEVGWRVLATHSIRQFPLHFPSRALQCAITFQLDSIYRLHGPISCARRSTKSLNNSPFQYFKINCQTYYTLALFNMLYRVFMLSHIYRLSVSAAIPSCIRTVSWVGYVNAINETTESYDRPICQIK